MLFQCALIWSQCVACDCTAFIKPDGDSPLYLRAPLPRQEGRLEVLVVRLVLPTVMWLNLLDNQERAGLALVSHTC